MTDRVVAWCNECQRRYAATTHGDHRIATAVAWRWTQCAECGDINLGVIHGEWQSTRGWLNASNDMMVDASDPNVTTFDEVASDA